VPTEHGRVTWTDERLDDLARRMDQGFARVDEDIRSLGARMDARFDALDAKFDSRIDALQRTMLAMMASILVAFAALIATQI
jgi:hypothetical protein